jgi:hypothetical protein
VLGLRKLVETIDSVALKTNSQLETRVTFREDGKTAFVEFLSCFEVGGPLQESSTISLKKNVPEDKRKRSGMCELLAVMSMNVQSLGMWGHIVWYMNTCWLTVLPRS